MTIIGNLEKLIPVNEIQEAIRDLTDVKKVSISKLRLNDHVVLKVWEDKPSFKQVDIEISSVKINCDFSLPVQLQRYRLTYSFKECVFNKEFRLQNYKNTTSEIDLFKCQFMGGVSVVNCDIKGMSINVNSDENSLNKLAISSHPMKKISGILIEDSKFSTINIFDCYNNFDSLTMKGVFIIASSDSEIKIKKFDVGEVIIENLIVNRGSFVFEDIITLGLEISNLHLENETGVFRNCYSGKISLTESALRGEVNFENLTCSVMELSGSFTSSFLSFFNLVVGEFRMTNFSTSNKFSFSNIEPSRNLWRDETIFEINRCDFDNVKFYNMNLRSFDKIQIFDCDFSRVYLQNVEWNWNYEVVNFAETEVAKTEIWSRKRNIHRQLKLNFEAIKDNFSIAEFKSYEIQSLANELFYRFIKWSDWKNIRNWPKKIGIIVDALLLALGTITNLNGRSPVLALIVLLVGSVGMSCWLLHTFENRDFQFFRMEFWSIHWQLFNPTHVLSRIEVLIANKTGIKTEFSGMTYFVDVLYRIFLAYMYFQFIRAARKYTR